jgi:parvulin-like peptidyl-prolyl isomerase
MIVSPLRYRRSGCRGSRCSALRQVATVSIAPAIWLLLTATTWAQPSGFPKGDPWADRPAATGNRPWNRAANPSYGPGAGTAGQNGDEAPPTNFREDESRPQPRRSGYKTRVSDGPQAPAGPPDIMAGAKPVEGAELLAEVGSESIFLSDILPMVKGTFDQIDAAVAEGQATEEQAAEQKRIIIRNALMGSIESKVLFCEFRRKLNKMPEDKRPKIDELKVKIGKTFDERLEQERKRVEGKSAEELDEYLEGGQQSQAIARLAVAMKQRGMWTHPELERYLRTFGTTIRKQKDTFAEQQLGLQTIYSNINMKPEVSHDEMLTFYDDNLEKYDFPSRAKFEVLMVMKSKFESKDEAYAAICKMGDEVYFGANFAAVAKRESQGFNAEKGGKFEWTPQGALASKALEEAIFTIELRKLSKVIEDNRGFYIVRVLEREEAGRKAFSDVQEEIRKEIVRDKQKKQYTELMTRIKDETRIWTVFDEQMKAESEKEEVARKRRGGTGLR